MPPKSIFRQPGAKHFQLVHRSQRDPLIHDPEASQHVLKHVVRENEKKGKSRAELEELIAPTDLNKDIEAHVGEAALFGVYYDDSQYNYMQHLRTVGVQEDGVESVLLEAPTASNKAKSKATTSKTENTGISLKDLPQESLPSASELPRTFDAHKAIPDSISGFQPDMDPHLRQALDALEDEAFVDDDLEDDFFGELVGDGERNEDEEFDYEFDENGFDASQQIPEDETEMSWEQRFARFKHEQKTTGADDRISDNEDEYGTEGGDTISGLPAISVIGGKRRRKGTSDASGYSMSSSSMFRNEHLQTLDERFDSLMSKEYGDEFDDEEEDESISDNEAPDLITSRADFNEMIDEFNDMELLGRKLRPKLAGETGLEKLNTFRRAIGLDDRVREGHDSDSDLETNEFLREDEDDDKKDRWDCETILTTYSNLENHPRLIRARNIKPVQQIVLDPKTGLPSVAEKKSTRASKTSKDRVVAFQDDDHTDDSDNEAHGPGPKAAARPKNETAEEKKARKAAVKADRAARRVDKKSKKELFGNEIKAQTKIKTTQDIERGRRKL